MRYWKIIKIIIRNSYTRDKKIPGVVTANVFSSLFEVIITLTMFSAIFNNVESLSGWNYYQVVFLYLMMKNIVLLNGVVVRGGLNDMAKEYVRMGDYDFYLVKPVNSMLFVSVSKPRFYNIVVLMFTIPFSIWIAMKTGIDLGALNILAFIFMAFFSAILYYFLSVITIVPTFWLVRLFSLSDLMNRATQIMRYPAGIYSMLVKVIFFTAFPVLAITYLPSWTLFYSIKAEYLVYMVVITFVFGWIATKLWNIGERNYGSASS